MRGEAGDRKAWVGLDDGQRSNSVGGRGLHGGEEKGQMKVRSQARG